MRDIICPICQKKLGEQDESMQDLGMICSEHIDDIIEENETFK